MVLNFEVIEIALPGVQRVGRCAWFWGGGKKGRTWRKAESPPPPRFEAFHLGDTSIKLKNRILNNLAPDLGKNTPKGTRGGWEALNLTERAVKATLVPTRIWFTPDFSSFLSCLNKSIQIRHPTLAKRPERL